MVKCGVKMAGGIARSVVGGIMVCLVLGGGASRCEASSQIWVSRLGNDTNTGTDSSPVRTLSKAFSLVDTGGEITVRDPSQLYGSLSVNKSVIIDGRGSTINHLGGDGMYISGSSFVQVTLRNLNFNGHDTSESHGVSFNAAGALNIENCTFTGTYYGIVARRNTTGYLKVTNCTIWKCSIAGIFMSASSGNVFSTLENVQISNCDNAIISNNGSRFTLKNSTLNSNLYGLRFGQTGSSSKGAVDNCMITNNSKALILPTLCTARIIDTSFVQNNVLHENTGGVFESDGTNVKISNATEGPAPTLLGNF